jgi:hypothetical protein
MAKISTETALLRTRRMLSRRIGVPLAAVQPTTSLRNELLMSDASISALEVPIETDDFADVHARVAPSQLRKAQTVLGLRGAIWRGIPDANKH